ncbi:MAG: phosphatidylglycerol lysyltransferase [Spirochaetaceae bacterium]|jgi:phosphoglucomutase|nr:phosphatidylglycerol lysyltransferase [Spirochaetaceae bacterium]
MRLHDAISTMTLSASGWRGIFSRDGDTEGAGAAISTGHQALAAAAGLALSDFVKKRCEVERPAIVVGMDTRPTGPALVRALVRGLVARGCAVRFAGVCAAPEIMAYARSFGNDAVPQAHAFAYASASHNPIGCNGFKFGLLSGGVLDGADAAALLEGFKNLTTGSDAEARIAALLEGAAPQACEAALGGQAAHKKAALDAYFSFAKELAAGNGISTFVMCATLQAALGARPLGVAADFNGSARTLSIDRRFWSKLNVDFTAINDESGRIVHRIVPEGAALEPCRALLEEMHAKDPRFMLGYVPDCDGDRGNLVVWDDRLKRARSLEGQEVFALCCVSELAHLVWTGELPARGAPDRKVAVAVNDATSMRVDKIAALFGAETFRAETGEANVVALAQHLRDRGYIVRILGEGAAGGNITHPSAVRDPLSTVTALVKLWAIRRGAGGRRRGFFEIWSERCGRGKSYADDFTLADVIESLPPFVTTNAYAPEAALAIASNDHSALKERYQTIFEREWELKKDVLQKKYAIAGYFASGFNGPDERCPIKDWRSVKKGGLKITFYDEAGVCAASLWMRGSGTENVFRVMADVDGNKPELERELLAWQRKMVQEADAAPS